MLKLLFIIYKILSIIKIINKQYYDGFRVA